MAHTGEKFYIGTTRFTNSSYIERENWRDKHEWEGCIYGVTKRISPLIPQMSLIYVLEMNNDTNQIEGIGLVRNYVNSKYKACIYKSDTNYNRFIYNSDCHIKRKDIPFPNSLVLLESIVFKGPGHYKRGQGITTISWDRFDISTIIILKEFFRKIFILQDRL